MLYTVPRLEGAADAPSNGSEAKTVPTAARGHGGQRSILRFSDVPKGPPHLISFPRISRSDVTGNYPCLLSPVAVRACRSTYALANARRALYSAGVARAPPGAVSQPSSIDLSANQSHGHLQLSRTPGTAGRGAGRGAYQIYRRSTLTSASALIAADALERLGARLRRGGIFRRRKSRVSAETFNRFPKTAVLQET
ncbi:hypothetical protein AAFF_G00081030 [Aldrovandia affinis]|uniref:Uncharacterized protein n=1 Tax=Aldrovandia affinis TaxID=143900 RepID=A0AAD7T3B3_9TELE|nr:hypothetical protein AAFF_G00081030 [Aldrovandia affinis]